MLLNAEILKQKVKFVCTCLYSHLIAKLIPEQKKTNENCVSFSQLQYMLWFDYSSHESHPENRNSARSDNASLFWTRINCICKIHSSCFLEKKWLLFFEYEFFVCFFSLFLNNFFRRNNELPEAIELRLTKLMQSRGKTRKSIVV